MRIIHLENSQDLQAILDANPYAIVDFHSTECPLCKALTPIYEKAADKHPDVKFVKIMRQKTI